MLPNDKAQSFGFSLDAPDNGRAFKLTTPDFIDPYWIKSLRDLFDGIVNEDQTVTVGGTKLKFRAGPFKRQRPAPGTPVTVLQFAGGNFWCCR
jgi:hypothetical protein